MSPFGDSDNLNDFHSTEPSGGRSQSSSDNVSKTVEDSIISCSLNMMDWIKDIQYNKSNIDFEKALTSSKQTAEQQTFLSRLVRNIGVTLTNRKFVEITEIELICEQSPLFWSGHIDSLKAGDHHYNPIATMSGWVLGRETAVTVVRLATIEMGIADAPVNVPRPDVRKAYSFATDTDLCGYNLAFNFSILPNKGTIQLQAIFADAQVVPFAFIKYQKYSGLFG